MPKTLFILASLQFPFSPSQTRIRALRVLFLRRPRFCAENHPLVLFRTAGSAHKVGEMKAAPRSKNKLSRLLEVAFDTALPIVIGYALILLSQSQPLF